MLACHGQRGEIPNSKMETLNKKYLKRWQIPLRLK
jgi:hypothetical protein